MPTVGLLTTGNEWPSVQKMFEDKGWSVNLLPANIKDCYFYDMLNSNILCFTGGEDVDPSLYNAERHPLTHSNLGRDLLEKAYFDSYPTKPKVGICRGGQFLNVMSDGDMEQHIEGHRNTTHNINDWSIEADIVVNSDHHQAMWPSHKAIIIASTYEYQEIYEALWYEHTRSLCFQPHPEWGHKETHDYFFELLERYFNLQ